MRDRQVYIGPEVVSLDISNSCNISCQYCEAHHAPEDSHYSEKVRFFPWGEKFLEIVRDCVDLKVDQIYTRRPRRADNTPFISGYDRAFGETVIICKIIHECDVSVGLLFRCDQRGSCVD